jgi:hypothetical protein
MFRRGNCFYRVLEDGKTCALPGDAAVFCAEERQPQIRKVQAVLVALAGLEPISAVIETEVFEIRRLLTAWCAALAESPALS